MKERIDEIREERRLYKTLHGEDTTISRIDILLSALDSRDEEIKMKDDWAEKQIEQFVEAIAIKSRFETALRKVAFEAGHGEYEFTAVLQARIINIANKAFNPPKRQKCDYYNFGIPTEVK